MTPAIAFLTRSQPTLKRVVSLYLTGKFRAGIRMLIGKLMTRVSSGPVAF